MPLPPQNERLLPANVKAIQKTVKAQSSLGKGAAEYRIAGARGLVLHAFPSGTASWYLHYDVSAGESRRRRKYKIGRYDEVSLVDAIGEAEALRAKVRQGIDPARKRSESRSALTFAELAEARLEDGRPLRSSTRNDYLYVLKKDILPAIGHLKSVSITRDHVIDVIDRITRRGATRRADTARTVMSSIFSFGIDRGVVASNPARDLRNRHSYRPRDTILNADQIVTLWRALESGDAAMSSGIAMIIKLSVFTVFWTVDVVNQESLCSIWS